MKPLLLTSVSAFGGQPEFRPITCYA